MAPLVHRDYLIFQLHINDLFQCGKFAAILLGLLGRPMYRILFGPVTGLMHMSLHIGPSS